jgi:glycosyltransferase involved in cell wall biosynthesis
MSDSPSVSVIIPTYNRAGLLREAVSSVLGQSCGDFELIIVDDGSTDGTQSVIEAFGDRKIKYLAVEHCANLSLLRNTGIRRSKGQFLAFLDSDDLWSKDKLALQMKFMEAKPDVGFVVSGYDVFDSEGIQRTKLYTGDRVQLRDSTRSIFDDLLRGKMTLCSSSILIRRTLLDRAGLLNEQLRTGDYELFTRLAWHSAAGIIHAPLVRVRKHAGNSSLRFDAEGLEEAIFSVRRFYSLGLIGRDLREERLLKYQNELAGLLVRRGDLARARREMFECVRVRPTRFSTWRSYALLIWKSLRAQSSTRASGPR